MLASDNKAVVRRFYEELWNDRKIEIADEIIAADCLTHQLISGVEESGAPRPPESMKQHVAAWLEGFPDMRFTVEQMIAEGDRVVTHCRMRGTHTGAWSGLAPTGREVSLPMIVIQRIAGGKIAEDWVLVDSLGFYQQLGLVPATGEIMSRATR
ncbi:MAG TPA: ester cyclase [Pyrinomonadaceae bacterium]|nr:ester cyclase [Pyrinomonadaceae bacterium]